MTRMWLFLIVAAVGASGTALPQESTMSTTSKPMSCNFSTPDFITIPKDRFHEKCFAPRSKELGDFLRIPNDINEFVSVCAVTLSDVSRVPPDHDCAPKDASRHSFNRNDQIMVTNWGNGQFTLTRLRDHLVIPLNPVTLPTGETPYLYGSKNDITYAVYLVYDDQQTDPVSKVYRVETFDTQSKEPALCELHKPIYEPKIVECKNYTGPKPEESSTSTGGEPPPNA